MSEVEKLQILRDSWNGNGLALVESIDTPKGDYTGVVLATLRGPALDYIKNTRNGRGYEEELWDEVVSSDYVKELFDTKNFLGEPDHPMQWEKRADIHYPYVSHAVRELIKNPTLGCYEVVIDILDTPNGRILKTLLDYGTQLGVSSRGQGRTIMKNGRKIVDKYTYRFITIDIVPMPGNASARMKATNESVDYNESEMLAGLDRQIDKMIASGDKPIVESAKRLLSSLEDSRYNLLLEKMDNFLNEGTINTDNDPSSDLLEAYSIIESMKSEMTSKDLMIKELTEKANADSNLQNTLSDLDEKYAKAKNLVKTTLLESTNLRRRCNELTSELSDLKESYSKASDELSVQKLRNSHLSKKVNEMMSELVESKNCNYEEMTELRESLAKSERDLESVNEQLNLTQEKCSEMTKLYISTRCNQLGLNANKLISEMSESINSYSIDKIDNAINESFKRSGRESKNDRLLEGLRISGSYSASSNGLTSSDELNSQINDELANLSFNVRSVRNI